MSLVADQKLYVCPGETHPISRAVHLGRLAAFYPACRECPYRADTGQLATHQLELVESVSKRVERETLFTNDGVRGVHRNELTRSKAAEIATALAGMLWEEAIVSVDENSVERAGRALRPSVVVGYDERPSSPDIVTGVTSALRRMGCQVIDIALAKLGRSRRFSEAKIAEQAEMVDLFIDLTYDLESRAASLARFAVRHNVQGYDAVYLALAMHLDAPLATLDSGLRAAARRAKVALA